MECVPEVQLSALPGEWRKVGDLDTTGGPLRTLHAADGTHRENPKWCQNPQFHLAVVDPFSKDEIYLKVVLRRTDNTRGKGQAPAGRHAGRLSRRPFRTYVARRRARAGVPVALRQPAATAGAGYFRQNGQPYLCCGPGAPRSGPGQRQAGPGLGTAETPGLPRRRLPRSAEVKVAISRAPAGDVAAQARSSRRCRRSRAASSADPGRQLEEDVQPGRGNGKHRQPAPV